MNTESVYGRLPIPLQNLACTWAGRQRARARFTPYFDDVLTQWCETGMSSSEALREIQQDRLIELVRRARRFVPHYQEMHLPEPEPQVDAAKGIEEILGTFPILEKTDYRDAPESFIASDIPSERLFKGKTSGTTGSALPLWYTSEALAEEYAAVWRLRRWQGIELDDRHLSFGGQLLVPLRQKGPPFWRHNVWGGQTLFSLYHMTKENLPAYIEAIHSTPAVYMQGYPSSFHLLGRAMIDSGRTLPKGQLKAIFPSSESLLAFHREVIEEAFGAPIFDRYGTSEFVVSMTGCTEGRLHLDMEFGIVEIDIQEETDDFVRGPLLVTGLGNDATPFIRYRVGDVGTRSKHACPCGRPGDVFLDVDGRVEDYIVTPDGRWVGRLDHIFKDQLDIGEAQIVQDDVSSIQVRMVVRPSFGGQAEKNLLKEIHSRLGTEIRVELLRVDEIPREANGKFRAVKSSVGKATGESFGGIGE
ncbi:MAG TPA: phenylacetate--CoA ligase family protein [Myxococcales bacterium]|nr:phenylacetate--CoA ligase family protein [Myxococcales bacterium]HIK83961.1 phenylacetate--CoA ligase family protein [Myxococcales bacterium]